MKKSRGKKIKGKRPFRNLSLPSWLKLRMSGDMKEQAYWMIDSATSVNADSVSTAMRLKSRPWDVILTVKRIHSKYGHR